MHCPHCRSSADFLFTARDSNRGHSGAFDYYRGACGLVFIGDIPADLGRYYEGGYQEIPGNEAELAKAARAERYRLNSILPHIKGGKFLEIGPWIGLTAYSALKEGFAVSAIELNADCVDLLRRSGINAIQSDDPARALGELDGQFDVIALWHSIEHLPRPWDVIAAAARKVAPGGILYVAAPNPESAQMRVFKERWFHLDAPRHLYFMPAHMVEEIAAEAGLVSVARTTEDPLGRILERDGWWQALHRHVPVPGIRRLYKLAVGGMLHKRHRRANDFGGAGFSVTLKNGTADDSSSMATRLQEVD